MNNLPKIKKLYNSLNDNIVEDFYVQTLSYFKYYDRVSAYFDSDILELYSTGIENIVINEGKIRFIFSHQITEKDYERIVDGYSERLKINIERDLVKIVNNLKDNKEISNLSYLIKHGFVDVKIALTREGVFHDKFGLIYDDNNSILFRGSANETSAAISKNYDSFETTCSWLSDDEIIDIRKENFNRLWNDKEIGVKVINAPDVLLKELIKYDKGKLIIENYPLDSIILDYQDRFYSINNLINKESLDKGAFRYRNILNYVDFEDEDKTFFKDKDNYLLIENIIKFYEEYTERINLNLHITDKLKNFIKNKHYDIDRMKSMGVAIKDNRISDFEDLNNDFNKFKIVLSQEMERVLREPQLLGSYHICKMEKSSNFSVPGSGKTSIVYGAFAYLNSKVINAVDKIVMIGPLNSFETWKQEFKMNFNNKKELRVLDTSKIDNLEYNMKFLSANKNLILINYEKLISLEKSNLFKEFIDDRTLLVFDEIHRIKNIVGKRAEVALNFSKYAKYKVALTGTPIPNGYQDIYNILNILYTDEYRTYFRYREPMLKEANQNYNLANKINADLYPFFIRNTKKDLNIPIPNEDDLQSGYVRMNPQEEKLYEIIYKTFNSNSLLLYIRLMQASLNPKSVLKSLDYNEDYNELFGGVEYNNKSLVKGDNFTISKSDINFIENFGITTKFYKGIELIKELVSSGKKVLVWCVFVDTIKLINQYLNKDNISNSIIYGDVMLEDRNEIIEDFKNGDTQVLISNPHTIAESISLHTTCHDAIYFEYTFNLTHMLQSRDRINRLGLEDGQYTQYYYLISDSSNSIYNSIDFKTYNRLKEKESLMLDAIENNNISYISSGDIKEDLAYIFKNNN